MTDVERLQFLRDLFQHWLDWNRAERAAEGLSAEPDTHLYAVPPHWPTRGSIEQWIAAIDDASALLRSLAADASRYRWLRDQYRLMSPHMDGNHHWAPKMAAILKGPSVDAAVDAAIQRGAKGGGGCE